MATAISHRKGIKAAVFCMAVAGAASLMAAAPDEPGDDMSGMGMDQMGGGMCRGGEMHGPMKEMMEKHHEQMA